jgi:hypothetical protein
MKFDERNSNIFLNPPFLFPWQLWQNLSYRFQFVWLIYHMPSEVVLLRVDFFKMAAVSMEMAKMPKN